MEDRQATVEEVASLLDKSSGQIAADVVDRLDDLLRPIRAGIEVLTGTMPAADGEGVPDVKAGLTYDVLLDVLSSLTDERWQQMSSLPRIVRARWLARELSSAIERS